MVIVGRFIRPRVTSHGYRAARRGAARRGAMLRVLIVDAVVSDDKATTEPDEVAMCRMLEKSSSFDRWTSTSTLQHQW